MFLAGRRANHSSWAAALDRFDSRDGLAIVQDRLYWQVASPRGIATFDLESIRGVNDMTSNLTSVAPPDVYRARRATLAAGLERPIVIFAGRARSRSYPDNRYPFRAGSSYLYFGGPRLEGAAWIIQPGSDGDTGCTLIRTPSTLEDAVWIGASPSDDELAHAAGVARDHLAAPEMVEALLEGQKAAAVVPPCLETTEWSRSLGLLEPNESELLAIIDLRLYKDEYEMRAMRHAADVTVEAFNALAREIRPGRAISEAAAAMMQTYAAAQCEVAFNPIVTTRGEVLHSEGFHGVMEGGSLLLVDAGAEEASSYVCDISRTYPVGGTFSDIQRDMYTTVLRAQKAAVEACVPGARYRDIHDLAARYICEGLVDAGLLKGDPQSLADRYAHTLFFTHGLGHLIGLEPHDMEDFGDLAGYGPGRSRRPEFGNRFLRLDRDLAPGMVVTVEPGIYFVPAVWKSDALTAPFADALNVPRIEAVLAAGFGGIRIEDTVHVTASDGPEVLTSALPKEPDELTAILTAR